MIRRLFTLPPVLWMALCLGMVQKRRMLDANPRWAPTA